MRFRAAGVPFAVTSIDKFPRMTDYVVPTGVRIADADRVRLGAHLAEGTTVMHEGFVNFNAGTLGASMVEGRISAGVVVGDGSDIGGGASIMGTLSGGGTAVISIGERCLLGANAGLGISLGDDCIVEAGLYVTAGARVTLPDGEVVKAARAERRRRAAVPPQLADRRDRGAAAQRPLGAASTPRCTPTTRCSIPRRAPTLARDRAPIARITRRRSGAGGGRPCAPAATLHTPMGLLAIDAVDRVDPGAIDDADARRAGHPDAAAVRAALRGTGETYRIAFHLAGPDPRIALRADAALSRGRPGGDRRAARALRRREPARPVDRGDAARRSRRAPGTRAGDLAERLGRELQPFKTDVRKLKALGLTESLEVGYRISPRGRAFLDGG